MGDNYSDWVAGMELEHGGNTVKSHNESRGRPAKRDQRAYFAEISIKWLLLLEASGSVWWRLRGNLRAFVEKTLASKCIHYAEAVRLLRLEAPKSVQVGQSVRMKCLVETNRGGDRLQSLSWYKNGREFFRYQPYERRQPVLAFNLSGVNVDLARSKNTTLFLVNATTETAGRYRCEVTGTSFQEVNMETFIEVTPAGKVQFLVSILIIIVSQS